MIEKLNIDPTQSVATNHCIINKINELVDAVNELQEFCDVADKNLAKLMEESTVAENVQPKVATMSDMKCPFCQQELKYDAWNEVYMCRNPNCKHLLGFGTKELWQELIRTRKALDAAKDTLHWYDDNYDSVVARNTLDEIKTALEQKDVK